MLSRPNVARRSSGPIPYLSQFAARRTEGETLPGAYDDATEMWMADGPDGRTAIIDRQDPCLELRTKTKVDNEIDDSVSAATLRELTTKTEANTEADDQRSMTGGNLELTTKTAAQLESDDTNPRTHGLW